MKCKYHTVSIVNEAPGPSCREIPPQLALLCLIWVSLVQKKRQLELGFQDTHLLQILAPLLHCHRHGVVYKCIYFYNMQCKIAIPV